jgi:hypothetical protein
MTKKKMNKFQEAHLKGEFDVYRSIEAYSEEWIHVSDKEGNFVSASPKQGTRRRQDLPSLSDQWKQAAKNNGDKR